MRKIVLSALSIGAIIGIVASARALPESFGIAKGWPLGPGQAATSGGGGGGGVGTGAATIDGSTAAGTSMLAILK